MSRVSSNDYLEILKFHATGIVALCQEVTEYVASGDAARDGADIAKATFHDDGSCFIVRFPRKASTVTPTNPSGETAQCARRDIHPAHEYQRGFGDLFNVDCPGNDGNKP